ncbi:LacI family DNA-binding transcriptional regulator [Saccharospirillum salsuginis]|uniref:Transcriptional regulator n=1 Tax=Saccharospirillum salsuginis TaxID=418750 RepID=A0A918K9J4_9GAMM|nr:LacI family DNA-binding transcriptional regulator [Saccharospirillum salsuginis]GGX55774.1 transcriptional regulator [Saccharospirillum salsuginis]
MPTIKEVSELAGVSQATVSRVMNGSDRVTEATKRRVMDAMKTLGYHPKAAAQSLASNRTNSIGMVVSELQGPFYGPMMAGVEEVMRKAHKHLIIAAGHGEEHTEREAIEFLINRQVDGLILLVERLDDDYLLALNERVPLFLINHHIQGLHDRTIWLDNELGGYRATRYLIDQGHERIACITGQMWKQDAQERLQGYQRAMAEAGIEVRDEWIVNSYFELEGGIEAFHTLMERDTGCTAVLACNDELAFGVLEAADDAGIKLPEQLSVMGFDNVLTARYVQPKLTTMNFPMYEMAQASARMVMTAVYEKQQTEEAVFEPTLVERQSVRSLR